MNKKVIEQICLLSKELRLPAFRKDIGTVITESLKQNASYEQMILSLLTIEISKGSLTGIK